MDCALGPLRVSARDGRATPLYRRVSGPEQPGCGHDDAADPDESDGGVEHWVRKQSPVGQRLGDDATLDDRRQRQ